MSKLLDHSLKRIIYCAGIVLVCSIPIYYWAISRLWQYEMDEHKVVLSAKDSWEDSFLIIGAVTLLSVVFFVLLLAALIFLNRSLSKRMWQPFYQSIEQIRDFDLENPGNTNFQKTGITEFDELNTSLQRLLSANLTVYHQQKEFADNASHELQTPLAIVQSKLELLSQSKVLSDDQFHLIEDAQAALSRAGRINKNLLLLTKIENSQFADKQSIDLSALLKEQLQQFDPFFEERSLDVHTDIEEVTIEGNKILVEILLGNLLTNVIRHSAAPGNIKIVLNRDLLMIINPGKDALQAEQLFKRFASANTTSPGTGLGLALVRQISMRYKWTASYRFEESMHVFQVSF